MTDTTIEAGRWYRRTRDGLVVRAAYKSPYADTWLARPVAAPENYRVSVATADLEPWVPRVGEWVRVGAETALVASEAVARWREMVGRSTLPREPQEET